MWNYLKIWWSGKWKGDEKNDHVLFDPVSSWGDCVMKRGCHRYAVISCQSVGSRQPVITLTAYCSTGACQACNSVLNPKLSINNKWEFDLKVLKLKIFGS